MLLQITDGLQVGIDCRSFLGLLSDNHSGFSSLPGTFFLLIHFFEVLNFEEGLKFKK